MAHICTQIHTKLWIWFKHIYTHTQRNISWILNEFWGFQLNAHLSVCCVSLLNNWSSSLQSPFVRMNSCASVYLSKRKYTFPGYCQTFNRHGWNTEARLICHRVNVLSECIVFALNAEQATSISCCYVFVDRYEIKYDKDDYVLRVKKASINDEGTFTCVAENRVGKLEASATLTVRGTKHLCSLLFFHIS